MVSPRSFHIPSLAKRRNRDGAPFGTRLRHPASLLARRRCRPAEGGAPERRVTARVVGVRGGVVTLTAATPPRFVVTASWGDRVISVTRMSEREALALANAWIDQLAGGREPTA
jgi:hypothetical protein